jgi:hypothetical protein
MKTTKRWLFGLLALGFVLTGCEGLGDGKIVDLDLHGTWESANTTKYSGTLVIGFDTITITGYDEDQTPLWTGNDNERPFRDFQKNVLLSCYTEDGKLFIEVFGGEKSVSYEYKWRDGQKQLWFQFGGRDEVLIKN